MGTGSDKELEKTTEAKGRVKAKTGLGTLVNEGTGYAPPRALTAESVDPAREATSGDGAEPDAARRRLLGRPPREYGDAGSVPRNRTVRLTDKTWGRLAKYVVDTTGKTIMSPTIEDILRDFLADKGV